MRRSLVLLLLACPSLLVPVPAAGSSSAPPAPEAVVVSEDAHGVVVSWTPVPGAPVGAVRYNVYGGSEDAFALLGSTGGDEPFFLGPGGHAGYAVTAVVDGVESAMSDGCFWVDWAVTPPQIIYEPMCERRAPRALQASPPEALDLG
jgi:hypothetical protein